MDTSYWTKLNPNIQFKKVTRSYFGKYFYKLDVIAVGAAWLRKPEVSIDAFVDYRRMQRAKNFGGSWYRRQHADPSPHDLKVLALLKCLVADPAVHLRVEEPCVSIYTTTAVALQEFAKLITIANDNGHMAVMYAPESTEVLELLQKGFVVKREAVVYPFKVHMREGRYSRETRQNILTYLENLGDDAQLPNHLVDSLKREFDSMWGGYFYIKDRNVVTMLSIIAPGFVRTIEESCQVAAPV